ncbi:hypothetical protein [Actinomadura fibrosa]|uniref:DUF4157 domain-containing protein n=1 Tax=Actinomadura fibrosa TaxID=111802 RepID=A0ABW2XQ92_9ACTN|nr:hypothetical protein [Actinomadura fibrosa]
MLSCKEQAERIEETVLQPFDKWVDQLQETCEEQPCIWWMFCLNKLFCWLLWVVVKVVEWVAIIVVRWVYRTVCTVVMIIVGIIALVTGNTDILVTALKDVWQLIKDGFYAGTGLIIFIALRIVDWVQTLIGVQARKRPLTEIEKAVLRPIYHDSLNYAAIRVVDGKAGILTGSGRAFTMGFTIYLPVNSLSTVVHESVHVWQFQFGGFGYIGNSAFNQLDSMVFNKGYDPYDWRPRMNQSVSWYNLGSAEAQAKFIEDVYGGGSFTTADLELPTTDRSPGAFFREDVPGTNQFVDAGTDYTAQANAAWRILRTG